MVRFVSRSGIWRNSEDEILKAAVMKYGLQQWSRISSLLVRKSAKQCKARWNEWLDPSIKKAEWSREEDEKLLHLAKSMPNRWRTIAPLLNRTPEQCIRHYEILLDQAAAAASAGGDQKSAGIASEEFSSNAAVKAHEVDTAAESKPARPDAVDMEDDELEMIAEARARMANTKGKKEKRKMREKQMEESKRITAIQKQRELKAAGIELKPRKRKAGEIDFATEIPFQRSAPQGMFDVAEENYSLKLQAELQGKEKFKPIALSDIKGGKNRVGSADALESNKKPKLKEKAKENLLEEELNKLRNEDLESQLRERSEIRMPEPQINQQELQQLEFIKMNRKSNNSNSTELTGEFLTDSTTGEIQSLRERQNNFKLLFSSIPAPQNEIKIRIPEPIKEIIINQPMRPMDAEEIELERRNELIRMEKEKFNRKTLVKQRELPIIMNYHIQSNNSNFNNNNNNNQEINQLIQMEMANLIKIDKLNYDRKMNEKSTNSNNNNIINNNKNFNSIHNNNNSNTNPNTATTTNTDTELYKEYINLTESHKEILNELNSIYHMNSSSLIEFSNEIQSNLFNNIEFQMKLEEKFNQYFNRANTNNFNNNNNHIINNLYINNQTIKPIELEFNSLIQWKIRSYPLMEKLFYGFQQLHNTKYKLFNEYSIELYELNGKLMEYLLLSNQELLGMMNRRSRINKELNEQIHIENQLQIKYKLLNEQIEMNGIIIN